MLKVPSQLNNTLNAPAMLSWSHKAEYMVISSILPSIIFRSRNSTKSSSLIFKYIFLARQVKRASTTCTEYATIKCKYIAVELILSETLQANSCNIIFNSARFHSEPQFKDIVRWIETIIKSWLYRMVKGNYVFR